MSIIWWLLFFLIICETSAFKKKVYDMYCTINCGKVATHTACKRAKQSCGAVTNCNVKKKASLTDKIRQKIVNLHNKLRSKVAMGQETRGPQPKAANMNVLNYNFELEFIAQCLANTCQYGHDECRDTKHLYSGQNIAEQCESSELAVYSEEALLKAVQKWYEEVQSVKSTEIESYKFRNSSEHYTQMIWGDIEALGCGTGHYKRTDGNWCVLLICNYGGHNSGGNMEKAAVYRLGEPCTLCPMTKRCNAATGLCGKVIPVKNTPRFNHAANVDINFQVCCLIFFSILLNGILS